MNVVKLLAIVLMVMAMLMLVVVVVVTVKMAPILAAGQNRKRHTRNHMMTLRGDEDNSTATPKANA